MTTFFLIRHAANDSVGNAIAGRSPGVHLNTEGRKQALLLAERLADQGIRLIFSSPLERARETAEALAAKLVLPVHISEAIQEVDFGDWTGLTFAELEPLECWKQWNLFRSGTRIPHGELISEVQCRMVKEMERLCREFPNDGIALVSHGEPIRSAIANYLGISLDLVRRVEISPASLTRIGLGDWGAQVWCVNQTG